MKDFIRGIGPHKISSKQHKRCQVRSKPIHLHLCSSVSLHFSVVVTYFYQKWTFFVGHERSNSSFGVGACVGHHVSAQSLPSQTKHQINTSEHGIAKEKSDCLPEEFAICEREVECHQTSGCVSTHPLREQKRTVRAKEAH